MAHFVSFAVRGLLLICTTNLSTNAIEIKGNLPDASKINYFLESLIIPFLQKVFASRNEPNMRTRSNETKRTRSSSTVEDVIGKKIAELRPLLQDDDEKVRSIDNLTIEGNDDQTTILEFLPKIQRTGDAGDGFKPSNASKTNIKQYKKMRSKIKNMLRTDQVSNDTRDIVINTLDDIIAQLIDNRCTWKAMDRPDIPVFTTNQLHELISRVHNLSDDQWSELKTQYEGFLQQKMMQKDMFLDMFHDFYSKVVNDSQSLLKNKYKIRCKLIETEKERQAKPRYNAHGESNKNSCTNFKVCSEELKGLMIDFYNTLNDTTVSAYKNYAEMYVKDVNIDVDLDKATVVSRVNHIGDIAEQKVAKIFKKQTKNIELDESKGRTANIKHLADYIKSTVEQVKKYLKKRTGTELSTLKTKLYLSIKADLDVNLDVDLGNIEKSFKDGICTRFALCNGGYSLRRRSFKNIGKFKDSNSVYVKIKLSVDDEMKQGIEQAQSKLVGYLRNSRRNNNGSQTHTTDTKPSSNNVFKATYSNLTVTRTTTAVTTNLTTIDVQINEV